ncbi:MAG: hypothetical protein P4N59_04775, partial [Negativicutes bacterium]|nr:hypothetical protein [Negativicutes bacterium]
AHGLRTTNTTQKNMRKTLLIAGAALAASIISSQAGVYSQNIVGYVNLPVKLGFTTLANPLDNGAGNSLTNLVPPGPSFDGSVVSVWTGTTFQAYVIDSSFSTGVGDPGDNFAVTPPTINPGQAFFLNNVVGSNTLTEVGTVHIGGAGTGTVGIATNTLPASPVQTFISSVLPVGGGLASVLQFTNAANPSAFDGCVVSVPHVVAGSVTGFDVVMFDSTFPTGFADPGDNFAVPEPVIPVGTGFFLNNTLGHSISWVQSY